ncbi:MAG: cell envelope biogenesis protein OmpA [Lutibacter sp.]|nr:MAG: cell envelope biogenesis protein OmpA [Lutibacter sp.]
MKHLRIALLALLVVAGYSNVNAQDENNPWAISFGINAVDFHPTNHPGEISNGGHSSGWFNEFFNAKDHYSILPSLSKISVGRYIDAGFSVELAGTLNRITKIGNWEDSQGYLPFFNPLDREGNPNYEQNPGDLNYLGLDLGIKYDLNNLMFKNSTWFDPFASVGGGYTWLDSKGTGTVNGGLGTNLWVSDSFGFNIQTTYKHAFDNNNIAPHFQHAVGFTVKFGGTDTDGDGIFDKEDACPEVFGLEEFNGCPDTDGDGIIDSEDACPDVAGLAELNGCPDADADGIADGEDNCPNEKGSKANGGCPDTDGDGIVDGKDNCPNEAGPAANNGCPWADKDGDKILDKDDACPEVAGVAEHNGCPPPARMTETHITELDNLARTVYFKSGQDSFTDETYAILDKIAGLVKDFPAESFHIAGHTDSQGSKASNQTLSEKRAAAVNAYLTSKLGNTFTSAGFGEVDPVASNNTSSGRAQNRRVEIKLTR